MSQIGTFETYRAADIGSWGKIGSDRRAVKVALLIHLKALADDRQKSDSSGLVGGPLLRGFLFCERALCQKCEADLTMITSQFIRKSKADYESPFGLAGREWTRSCIHDGLHAFGRVAEMPTWPN
jgi:hypothetical protein